MFEISSFFGPSSVGGTAPIGSRLWRVSLVVLAYSLPLAAGALQVEKPCEGAQERSRAAEAPDTAWDDVLRIADSRGADSRSRLEAMAKDDETKASTALARRILRYWKDEENTYYLKVPFPLREQCLGVEEMRALFPARREASLTIVSVAVDDRGIATDVTVLSGSDDDRLVAALTRGVRSGLFCPARTQEGYVAATATIQCRVEVR